MSKKPIKKERLFQIAVCWRWLVRMSSDDMHKMCKKKNQRYISYWPSSAHAPALLLSTVSQCWNPSAANVTELTTNAFIKYSLAKLQVAACNQIPNLGMLLAVFSHSCLRIWWGEIYNSSHKWNWHVQYGPV